jgi:hypothetical protein
MTALKPRSWAVAIPVYGLVRAAQAVRKYSSSIFWKEARSGLILSVAVHVVYVAVSVAVAVMLLV